MFNLQSYSETSRDSLSIEFTSRATSWESQWSKWMRPIAMGNVQGKSLSSCLPLQSITLQTVLLREIITKYSLPRPLSHVLLLAAHCPAGREGRRLICPSIAYCGQAGTGSKSEQGRNSTHPAPLYRNASILFPSPLGLPSLSHRLERLATRLERSFKHAINSGNTQEKTAGLSELPSNSFYEQEETY